MSVPDGSAAPQQPVPTGGRATPGEGSDGPAGGGGAAPGGSGDAAADEQELLDAFERLAPAGSLQWGFDDALRRLSPSGDRGTWVEPWGGLPADLWDRGRGAKAGERMLGDVITTLAQELTEYAQRIVDDVRRTVPTDTAVFDALRYLAARVDRLETAADPLGIRPADLALPVPDATVWSAELPDWVGAVGHPVVVGELEAEGVVAAVAGAGVDVDGVDPRGPVVWGVRGGGAGRPGQVRTTLGDVQEHLDRLSPASRGAVVLSGCVDRCSVAAKVQLVTAAARCLTPGGALVLLVADQSWWDEHLAPPLRDLLPGRPLHPDTWTLVLGHLGLADPVSHQREGATVHAVVARSPR